MLWRWYLCDQHCLVIAYGFTVIELILTMWWSMLGALFMWLAEGTVRVRCLYLGDAL